MICRSVTSKDGVSRCPPPRIDVLLLHPGVLPNPLIAGTASVAYVIGRMSWQEHVGQFCQSSSNEPPMSRLSVLAITVVLLVPAASQAQRRDPTVEPMYGTALKKNRTAARFIGIIPGAGHIYAGETGRGIGYFAAVPAILIVGGMMMVVDCVGDLAVAEENCTSPLLEGLVLATTFGFWGWTIYDAGLAADRANAPRGFRMTLRAAPGRIPTASGSERGVHVGVSVRH